MPVVFAPVGQLLAGVRPSCSTSLEEIINSYGGRLVLGAADIDAFPQLAQAFQVQAVPTAVAVVKGQPVPLFQGGADEQQVRSCWMNC